MNYDAVIQSNTALSGVTSQTVVCVMALSNKKSRPISVSDQSFRWQFFEGNHQRRRNDVTIQHSSGVGAKLVVTFPWSHTGTPHISLEPPVTPATIRAIIESAMESGWHPDECGQTQKMVWKDNKLRPAPTC